MSQYGFGLEGAVCSVCEMGIDMATLRCHIDFYGPADIDTVIVHIMKHIAAIQSRLAESKTAKDVYLAMNKIVHHFH